ncbi:RNA-dependent RNA polymerase [Favolaschia claudopus]|uniref:RNA-dependent RNA polymerase n=1 Tax=Favolaschia claudopus TaxID=2862362 RepID=A0AAW0EHS0_9AGAR
MGEFEGVPDYYGGNIQCRVSLLHAGDGEEPKLRLEPLEMTRSTHLARELGSVSVIALRDNKKGQLVKQYARRKFILCGRSYVALPPKDNKVYLIETNEDYDRVAQEWCGDQHRISYDEFLRRNNPLKHNANQPFAKYLTRINLYLSTSIPVVEFAMEGIVFIDDLYAAGLTRATAQTEQIMTDGCGFINRAAASKINAKLQYERLPVAFQARIAGSKGVWIIHPSDDSTIPRIWIRYSQKKIALNRPNNLARGHRIFELLAVSKASLSAHLSAQSLIILSHNGVPSEVFTALQKDGLENLIRPLMDWRRPNATAYLWNAVNEVSNVTRSRLQRLAISASRALGFEKRRFEELELAEDSDMVDFENEDTTHTGRNSWSGEPLALSEATMDLLQAGFDPLKLPVLSGKLHHVIKATMETFLSKYKIPLDTSFEAYMVPDPSGLLHEGQVFYKSSLDPDGPLRGEIVLGRYPMREPSDMQKVMAVDIPELAPYLDVLVVPIQGSRSLASLLAGGDTDGDEVIIIRDPNIVGPFQNQAFVPPPADFLSTNFERRVQTVTEFGRKLQALDVKKAQPMFQEELLIGLSDAKVGIYSKYHDVAAWEWGLDDRRTRRIAQMTATLLDASKTGLRLKPDVGLRDQGVFNRIPRPHCFDTKDGIQRKRKLGPFVLDSLLAAGTSQKDQLLQQFEKTTAIHLGVRENRPDLEPHVDLDNPPDPDIEGAYHRLTQIGKESNASIAEDLEAIRAHIHPLRVKYKDLIQELAKEKDKQQDQPQSNQEHGNKPFENAMLGLIRNFRQPVKNLKILHLIGDVDEIKASWAFHLGQKFGFSMAFRDICELKRTAELKCGPFNKVAIIDDAKSMAAPARRLLKHMGEEK